MHYTVKIQYAKPTRSLPSQQNFFKLICLPVHAQKPDGFKPDVIIPKYNLMNSERLRCLVEKTLEFQSGNLGSIPADVLDIFHLMWTL